MRLIDADELKSLPFERMIHTDYGETAIPIEEIDNAETIIPFASVETQTMIEYERPHGEWQVQDNLREGYYICSYCGEISCCKGNFCSDCGADMRGNNNG